MAIPPKGDPRRPLLLAVRSVRMLGIVFILLSVFASIGLILGRRGAGGGGGFVLWIQIIAVSVYLVPGIVYLLCAIYIKQRRSWAITVGIVLTSLHLAMVLIGAAITFPALIRLPNPVGWVTLVIYALIIAALAQTIYYLSKSFRAIREWPGEEQRGFEPLGVQPMPTPIPPPPPTEPPG